MSLDTDTTHTTTVKAEFTIADDVDIKAEELNANVLEAPLQGFEADFVQAPLQTCEAQSFGVEFDGAQMEEPYFDSEGCSQLAGLHTKHAQVDVILDAKQPLCVVSEVKTLADGNVEKLVTKTGDMQKEKIVWMKCCEATKTGHKILAEEHSCSVCRTKTTIQSYKMCTECEIARAHQQLYSLYGNQKVREKKLLRVKHSNGDEAKSQTLGGRPMTYAKNPYPTIRNCWVQLERCPAAEEALRLRSSVNISRLTIMNASSHTKKPYYCKICKTNVMTPLDTMCHLKNLKQICDCSVSLERCDKAQTAQFTKNFKSIFNTNESYMSEKSYSCEMCNINITITGDFRKNRRFCRDCELEQATNQLRNVINLPCY